MAAIIQVISTIWTQYFRGAPNATLRNAVPEAVALSEDVLKLPDSSLIWHEVRYREPEFTLSWENLRSYDVLRHNLYALEIGINETSLTFEFDGKQRLIVPEQCYGRVVFYFRSGETQGDWYQTVYSKICVNGILGKAPRAGMFTDASPKRELRIPAQIH